MKAWTHLSHVGVRLTHAELKAKLAWLAVGLKNRIQSNITQGTGRVINKEASERPKPNKPSGWANTTGEEETRESKAKKARTGITGMERWEGRVENQGYISERSS